MLSLFNPWVILGILVALASSFVAGHHQAYVEQEAEIAKLNQKARETEQQVAQQVNDLSTKLVRANQNAKIQIQKRDADIASGKLRLSIATSTVSAASNATSAGGDSVQTRAELDPATAQSLVAITDQGDANTRQLNACIDAYNAAYSTLTGGKK